MNVIFIAQDFIPEQRNNIFYIFLFLMKMNVIVSSEFLLF